MILQEINEERSGYISNNLVASAQPSKDEEKEVDKSNQTPTPSEGTYQIQKEAENAPPMLRRPHLRKSLNK